jgi:hypothetical protein
MAVPYGGEQWECDEPQRLQVIVYMVFFFLHIVANMGDYGIVGQDKNPSWEVTWTENWLGEYENCFAFVPNIFPSSSLKIPKVPNVFPKGIPSSALLQSHMFGPKFSPFN